MPAVSDSRYMVQAGWDDVPHLTPEAKADLISSTPRHLRAARSKGEPSMGAGAIYPFPIEEIICIPFSIPAYWPRAYGLDVGWNRTAAIWMAWDKDTDVIYLYTEHYMGQERPTVHATAIRSRGGVKPGERDWIPGCIDPASRGRDQKDGEQIIENYRNLGLNLRPADNAVAAGLWSMEERFGTGRLKVFSTCQNFLAEYRLYRRDEKGQIVKKHDHLMDAARYVVHTAVTQGIATTRPIAPTGAAHGHAGLGDVTVGY